MKRLEKGFTLIELMIVVAIIAILAAVAAPKFGQQIKKAKDAKGLQVVGAWRSALTLDYADSITGTYATQFTALADNVDAGTLAKTFKTTGGVDSFSAATNREVSSAYVLVGNPAEIKFTISTDAIVIDTTAAGADAVPWNTK